MIKVLSASQVGDNLIGNLCRYHAQVEKVPGNIELSHKACNPMGKKIKRIDILVK